MLFHRTKNSMNTRCIAQKQYDIAKCQLLNQWSSRWPICSSTIIQTRSKYRKHRHWTQMKIEKWVVTRKQDRTTSWQSLNQRLSCRTICALILIEIWTKIKEHLQEKACQWICDTLQKYKTPQWNETNLTQTCHAGPFAHQFCLQIWSHKMKLRHRSQRSVDRWNVAKKKEASMKWPVLNQWSSCRPITARTWRQNIWTLSLASYNQWR